MQGGVWLPGGLSESGGLAGAGRSMASCLEVCQRVGGLAGAGRGVATWRCVREWGTS